ncbi:GNAT family N-acetyltransferase [Geoalkalibacter halelectricus]|uniref:GNAT family N-acetyltransferase n=1 Tax=Geoalkalibacter halelectricus TaxID=2847045 RepID=A0ABY5ZLW3_9BACT|nr:GNAT family N-acetyltransferase [Geoalkalibacter halelectricus]MDO3378556.1 GNAT family N-acetyltransferase [Geoalkalibacter halelectricus]UWZ80130.1 GNAT family N-acetyltransferase [Geoalkalibacter halelectricus]
MKILPASEEDLSQLGELLNLLFTQEADFTPDEAAQRRGLALILAHPEQGQILVAREADRVLGMVNLLYTLSTALGGRVALLEDMVVHPEARGRGLGAALLEQAVAVARQQGCLRITLLTDADNQAAQRFYRRHGFELSTMVPMRLKLG